MTTTTFLVEAFVIVDVFAMGVVAVLATQHGRAHYRPPTPPPQPPKPKPEEFHLSEADRERLYEETEVRFHRIIAQSSAKLHRDLDVSTDHINKLVINLATDIISDELERYRDELAKLEKQAETDMGGIRAEIAKHKTEIETKVAQEIQAEKLRLLKQIDTKLADAVGSFLLETLGHEVDLGSQAEYLTKMLETHKADFTKELTDDRKPA